MKILLLTTYPISTPIHGGQLRVRNIADLYESLGYDVYVRGVLGSNNYKSENGFVPFPSHDDLNEAWENPFLMEDYALGLLYAERDKYFQQLARVIDVNPDVVQVEHPWLFGFAIRYIKENGLKAKVIYSSHNIESQLKCKILTNHFGNTQAQKAAKAIESIEKFALANAHKVICVSQNDFDWSKQFTSAPIILAPNGVKEWVSTKEGLRQANQFSDELDYCLYCASAHPPNMTGFFDIFGKGFGSLPPDQHLIVAGGAGEALIEDPRFERSAHLPSRVKIAGIVSQELLNGLLDRAHCIVLPLTQGGGTNLKTAEALISGKYVIATTVAMRGFEKFLKEPGVFVCDKPEVFKRKLREVMQMPPLELSSDAIALRKSVSWQYCLSSLSPI